MAEYIDRSDVFNPQTPIALKDDVWSVLTLDSLNRLKTVIATAKGQLENAELDASNRLKVVPTRVENIHKNAMLNILYTNFGDLNHAWTERINYTVPSDKIGVLQAVHIRTDRPSSGTTLAVVITVNNADLAAYINENQAASLNRTLHIPFQYVLPPGTNIVARTYSTDTTRRGFVIAIHIVLYPIET